MKNDLNNRIYRYLVGGYFAGFLVDCELCAFLIRLLDDRVFHLTIDAFVLVSRVNLRVKLLSLYYVFK